MDAAELNESRFEIADDGAEPLFILSFRHRDTLTRAAEAAGWHAIASRRPQNSGQRFVDSRAPVAVIDLRGASLAEGITAVRALAPSVDANHAALLVLADDGDEEALEEIDKAGATHVLVSPFHEPALRAALRSARRYAERVSAGRFVSRRGRAGSTWRFDPDSKTVELSPALARRVAGEGETRRRIPLMELFRRMDRDGRRAARGAVGRLMAGSGTTAFAHSDAGRRGGRIAHHMRTIGEGGEVVGRSETIRDGSLPFHSRDPLTGVRDAGALEAWLEAQLADEEGGTVILILLAVSRFDAINAAFGRSTGDAVLQATARRVERQIDGDASSRLVARISGAEFAIALAATTLSEGEFLAGQLVEALARPFVSGDHVITIGSRAGVLASEAGDTGATFLQRGRQTLAEARAAEAAPVRVVEPALGSDTALGDRLEVDLRRALDSDQIEILFQPQVSMTNGRIIGVEALARWRHPTFGELGAMTLFSVAERSDYLVQLSDHVQRKAIAQAAAWPEALSDLRLSVNITAADIVRPGFAGLFLDMVAQSGFDRDRLTVEVTETGLIEDLGAAATLLAGLREGGLRVAIDDFGTGYSSLAYLKALPLDYLKIDKRLCEDITGSVRDRIVVRGVIDMARSLGLAVIAEGVETEEQLDLLAQEGCNLYQGFLHSRPVSVGTLELLLAG